MKLSVFKSALTRKSTGNVNVVLSPVDVEVLTKALTAHINTVMVSDDRHLYTDEYKNKLRFVASSFTRIFSQKK